MVKIEKKKMAGHIRILEYGGENKQRKEAQARTYLRAYLRQMKNDAQISTLDRTVRELTEANSQLTEN